LAQAKLDILEKHVNDQICGVYESGSQALPCYVFSFMQKPKEQTLRLSIKVKQQWFKLVQVAAMTQKE